MKRPPALFVIIGLALAYLAATNEPNRQLNFARPSEQKAWRDCMGSVRRIGEIQRQQLCEIYHRGVRGRCECKHATERAKGKCNDRSCWCTGSFGLTGKRRQ